MEQTEMNVITPYHPNTSEQWDFSAYNYSDRQLTQASVSQQQNKDITIFTEDGDRVTISSDQQSQAFYSNYSSFSQQGTSGAYSGDTVSQNQSAVFQDERFEYENSRYLSISVDGDLNEQELKDVRNTIKAIDEIMTNLLHGGDITKGIERALSLVSLDSISGIAANYSYENAVSVEHTIVEEISTYSKEGLPENIMPVTNNEVDNIKNLIAEMIDIVKDSGIKPSKIINPIKEFFFHLLKDLFDNSHQNKDKITLAKLIESELIEKIKQLPW